MTTYSVNALPTNIGIGRQTETGVTDIRIDCAPWLAIWPELSLSIWVTPPGGAAAYPAATHMEGDILVWDVNDGDTAVKGTGTMEVMGLAEGLKKLSSVATTHILRTTTGSTGEPPEPAQLWVDQVINAAQNAATEAAELAATEAAELVAPEAAELAATKAAEAVEQKVADDATRAEGAAALAQSVMDSIPDDYATLSANVEKLETETGLKRESGTELVPMYNYWESLIADGITQNPDGKIYTSTGSLGGTTGSTSYRVNVKAGDVYIISTRLSGYYLVLFSGSTVYKAYAHADVGAEITASGIGTYRESNKAFENWRLVIPDGVDALGVTVSAYANYNSTLFKEVAAVEYIDVSDVKEKAETAYEHAVMPVTTMPKYMQNALAYKPLGALSKPYICLSTDDGREGLIHQTIEMVVDVAHVPVTFCIHSNADIFYEQKRKKYTLAQVAEKINNAIVNEGCELALHDNKIWADMSESKKTPYTEATLHQFVQNEKAFIANPFEQDTSTSLGVSWEYKSASAPEHATNAVVSIVMGGEFGVLRSGDTNMGLIKNIYDYKCLGARSNLYCLTSKNINSGMYNTLAKAKAAVDYAVANNLVLPIFWHEAIMASATEESTDNEHVTDEQISTILLPMIEYAKSKGVEFVTLSQIPYLQ